MPSNTPSGIVKRSIIICGRKTSVSIEDPFWVQLRYFASCKKQTMSEYVGAIEAGRQSPNLSSKLRLHVLEQVAAERESLRGLVTIGASRQ